MSDALVRRREQLRAKALELGLSPDEIVGDQPDLLVAINDYAIALDVPLFLAFDMKTSVEELFRVAEEMRAEGYEVNPD